MKVTKVERDIAGRTLSLETGKVARQADGAVWVRYGDTIVLATVLCAPPKRDVDFFPLFVDYREKQYAAGKVPGGFFKREGRPTTHEITTMRMIDRPIRPLFPKDYRDEVQIQCLVLSTDNENAPDLLALIGASAALALSGAPFDGPIGAARVGYVDGEYVLNPTYSELDNSTMDLTAAGPHEGVNMLELAGEELPDEVVAEGIAKATDVSRTVVEMIRELAEKAEAPASDYAAAAIPDDLLKKVTEACEARIREAKQIAGKQERGDAIAAIGDELLAELCPEDVEEPPYSPAQVKEALFRVEGKVQRELILGGTRPDGRGPTEVRPLSVEAGVLPRTHGSGLFARGETQALVTATLGTPRDQQVIDGLLEEYKKPFMLHYNFPPFCVGEIRPIRGPGRREIGHGMLAEKSLQPVMPAPDAFPYTVRIVADMLESNGSTSMAAVTGGTLALMDAGVPIKAPVAGISIGMVSDGDRHILLTDIIGEEDFHGEMDFKVAGTVNGITGIQLDMKARFMPQDRVAETLDQARQARLHILDAIEAVLPEPRGDISQYAPRMLTVHIDPEKIGKVIGPGGKTINRIQDETGANIDIEDDGTVYVAALRADAAEAAKEAIETLTAEVEVGKVYTGKVVTVRDFGAFVELFPGQDGMCHISELEDGYVKKVTDVVNVGDTVKVKVVSVDDQGRVRLSRKQALQEEGATEEQGADA
ncbi:MAG: polyribonucleotide nucleotidyltransferase [Phycisphaerae bacterium]|nr:polyribonucleotide nucleotidyltransferase [Phycisphaerae bacterium]